MLISRGRTFLKHVSALTKQRRLPNKVPVRNHGDGEVGYRYCPEPSRVEKVLAELTGGIMWWWILWHMWHDWGHIVGEFDYPDASQWTDEELGIPPDDVD